MLDLAMSAEVSDAQLVASSLRGSEEAWGHLVRRYQRLVLTVARSHHLTHDDCGEVFAAVFAELWRALPGMSHPEQVRPWLVTVARRQSCKQIQYHRRWLPMAETGMSAADPAPVGEALLLQAEREQAMRQALEQLPSRCRHMLEWLFFTDPPPDYREIGRRLGLAANSVGFVRGRCLNKLRRALDQQHLPEAAAASAPLGPGRTSGAGS